MNNRRTVTKRLRRIPALQVKLWLNRPRPSIVTVRARVEGVSPIGVLPAATVALPAATGRAAGIGTSM
jgi:hypothetical protein